MLEFEKGVLMEDMCGLGPCDFQNVEFEEDYESKVAALS
jgi:hypothetical protein